VRAGGERDAWLILGPATAPGQLVRETLMIPAGVRPRYPSDRARWQRLPAGNDPGAFPRLHGVGDAGKQPAQLDRGRQLAVLLEGGADCGGFCLGDDEHPRSMGMRTMTGKPYQRHAREMLLRNGRAALASSSRARAAGMARTRYRDC